MSEPTPIDEILNLTSPMATFVQHDNTLKTVYSRQNQNSSQMKNGFSTKLFQS